MRSFIYIWILVFISKSNFAQQRVHVHNDYKQNVPFWKAVSTEANSIEVDLILQGDTLYVAHENDEIHPHRTFQKLYLTPLTEAIQLGIVTDLQVLIDIKSEPYATLDKVVTLIKKYAVLSNNEKIKFVISGRKPETADYAKYPRFISFDYQSQNFPTDSITLQKIDLVSFDFEEFSVWNGKGKIVSEEYAKLKAVIDKVHSIQKPIRFWATPDSKSSWKALSDMGVDYINTDDPYRCVRYLQALPRRWYQNTTFSDVYHPSFSSDKRDIAPKNIILMIGDGNGLSQISSAVLANGGALTLTQLKSSGFIKTQSADDFTTDSAAAGTALATGHKTKNRAIGVDASGTSVENITEYLAKHNYVSGCITTDEIYGATPSAFYAHQKDRGQSDAIANELMTSKLSLFIGGGSKKYTPKRLISNGFSIIKNVQDIANTKANKVGCFLSRGGVPSILEGRKNKLAEATKNSINFLDRKNKPFFLMVESAQIDTYGHFNSAGGIITETIDFDKAITEAIQYADKDKNTLVIILADHETGGFAISQGNMETHHIEGDFITFDHTGMLVPVFAYGPRSYEFEGCYENNEIFHKILNVLELDTNTK